jgi:hypothetical protein
MTESNDLKWAAPTTADAAPSWRSGNAWMAGDYLHILTARAPIPLREIDNILISDESSSKTPGWAIALAVILFPIGLLFLLCKKEIRQSRITVYVKGNPATPITIWSPFPVGQAQAEWYPVVAAIKAL